MRGYNMACANGNIDAANARDNIGSYLTRNEMAESQRKARDYIRGDYEDTSYPLSSAVEMAVQSGDDAVLPEVNVQAGLINNSVRGNSKNGRKSGYWVTGCYVVVQHRRIDASTFCEFLHGCY